MKIHTPRWQRIRAAALAVMILSLSARLPAANRTWDGGGANDFWTNASNWNGRLTAPAPGDNLAFPAGATQLTNSNNFAARTDFNALTFSAAGYNIAGNLVRLSAGVNVAHGTGNTILNLPLELGAHQTFTISQAGSTLFLLGTVSLGIRTLTIDGAGQTIFSGSMTDIFSSGRVTKSGTGTLYILSEPAYGGTTTVNGGIVRVDGRLTNSRVTVNSGGTLRGVGTVAGITANSGGTVGPGFNTTNALNSSGDLILNAGSTLNIRLNGTSPELNYDQIDVAGAVTLGGTLNVTAGFAVPVGTVFTIIDNDGTDDITGIFAGLPEGAEFMLNGRPFRISYGLDSGGLGGVGRGNDVTLEAIPALCVWDGGGGQNRNWSTPQNWTGDIPPQPGDDLEFPFPASNPMGGPHIATNDFPPGRRFGKITVSGYSVDLGGSAVTLEGGMLSTVSFGPNGPGLLDINFPITLGASQTIRATGGQLVLNGEINVGNFTLTVDTDANFVSQTSRLFGAGGFVKTGPAAFEAKAPVECQGPVTVNEGFYALSEGASVTGMIRMNGGTLDAADRNIGSLEAHGGSVSDGNVLGAARFFPGARYVVGFNQPIDRLAVAGQLDLGGCDLVVQAGTGFPSSVNEVIPIIRNSGPPVAGTFAGLPEGARFVQSGTTFAVTYHGGVPANDVALIINPLYVWDGGGTGTQWMTAGNWNPDYAPVAGGSLVFPDGVSERIISNDFPADTAFRTLTFERNSYIISGNAFQATVGIYNNVASGLTAIFAPVRLFQASSEPNLMVTNASELQLGGAVTGVIRKEGSGVLTLSGNADNGLSSVFVRDGRVHLQKSGAIALTGIIRIGGFSPQVPEVRLNADDQIDDDAEVEVSAGGRLDLNGHSEAFRELSGTGQIILGIFGQPGSLTLRSGDFDGSIGGTGNLTITGGEEFALGGNSSILGAVRIESALDLTGTLNCLTAVVAGAGSLTVDGTLSTPAPLQLQGGTLRGRGTVPAINATGGMIQPGFDGSLRVLRSGAVTMNSSTTFRPTVRHVDPGFETSKLSVTGAVNLGGAALSFLLQLSPPLPNPGFHFVLLENDGGDPISGTFAGLSQGTVFEHVGPRWQISYTGGDGNDVTVTFLELLPIDIRSFSILPGTGADTGKDIVVIDWHGIPTFPYEVQLSSDLVNWITPPATGIRALTPFGDFRFERVMPPDTARSYFRVQWK